MEHEISKNQVSDLPMLSFLAKRHMLLPHAGGDSKRVPLANPMGKGSLPLPYLAANDPDGPDLLLFDHILAVASCARQAFKNEGGIFIMTSNVIPCFDASTMILPLDASCIVTVPITLDVAANHGVVVASNTGVMEESYMLSLVDNLLQKPSVEELAKSHAILDDGRALLDTGMIAARGKAWFELVVLASCCPPSISELLKSRKEMSLYEDLVAAWVPAKHGWLRRCPWEKHLSANWENKRCSVIVPTIFCFYNLNKIEPGVSIGDDDSTAENSFEFILPDCHCLWEVPLVGSSDKCGNVVNGLE
ncbi:hypothetical protein SLE2022_181860 [Rubroshorea leprosula]